MSLPFVDITRHGGSVFPLRPCKRCRKSGLFKIHTARYAWSNEEDMVRWIVRHKFPPPLLAPTLASRRITIIQ